MVKCCAPGCNSTDLTPKGALLSYHEIPSDEPRRSEWIKRIKNENWVPNSRARVCSKHFAKGDFTQGIKRRRLIPNAIPSVFPNLSTSCLPTQFIKQEIVESETMSEETGEQIVKTSTIDLQSSSDLNTNNQLIVQLPDHSYLKSDVSIKIPVTIEIPPKGRPIMTLSKLKSKVRDYQKVIVSQKERMKKLKARIVELKKKQPVVSAKTSLVDKVKMIESDFQNGDTLATFLHDQLKAYKRKKPRWQRETIRLCHVWRTKYCQGYEFARSNKLLRLPGEKMLNRYIEEKQCQPKALMVTKKN